MCTFFFTCMCTGVPGKMNWNKQVVLPVELFTITYQLHTMWHVRLHLQYYSAFFRSDVHFHHVESWSSNDSCAGKAPKIPSLGSQEKECLDCASLSYYTSRCCFSDVICRALSAMPVMTYGSETWALTTAQMDALAVAQRKMERIMLGITLRDQRHNTWIQQQTGVTDIIDHIRQLKHRWAGHVARLQDNRWTIRATSWVPRRWLRPRGRPKTRWRDDLSGHLGTTWTRLAQDRHQWKLSREGFLHKGEKW